MRRSRFLLPLAVILAVLVSLTGCGDDEADQPSGEATTTKRIEVTVEGGTISPNGERVEVSIGQPVEFEVKSDAEGELHVHSDPEQELEYKQGTTILELGSFDRAGIIEVESHTLEKTVVQLEVK